MKFRVGGLHYPEKSSHVDELQPAEELLDELQMELPMELPTELPLGNDPGRAGLQARVKATE